MKTLPLIMPLALDYAAVIDTMWQQEPHEPDVSQQPEPDEYQCENDVEGLPSEGLPAEGASGAASFGNLCFISSLKIPLQCHSALGPRS